MERIREGRRGNLAAVNGLSRRRPRSGSLRDSPEEDGGAEMQETGRLRDRGNRKDRDRDRSTRSKRRRGDRLLNGGNRDEGEDSTDESIDDDEEDDGEDTVPAVRLAPPPLPLPLPPFSHPSPPPVTLSTNHNHRKIFPSKVMRPPPAWKAADEMIGVSVPRKARTAHAKRSQECLPSGSVAGGELMHRPTSSSPSRSSQTSATAAASTPISPSSSNAPMRKKTKQIACAKQRPSKISKSPSSIQEIEIEVAEVLYGLTRQFQDSSKTDAQALDFKEANGTCNETKSRASSPNCLSPSATASHSQSQATVLPHAPKRKRPRPVKYDDESSASPSNRSAAAANISVSSSSKAPEGERPKAETPSPKSEKTTTSSPPGSAAVPPDSRPHPPEDRKSEEMVAVELETSVHSNEHARGSDGNSVAASSTKPVPADDRYFSGGKFQIDLMAPPPGKTSPETEPDFVAEDSKASTQYVEKTTKFEFLKTEGNSRYERAVAQEALREGSRSEKIPPPSDDASLEAEKGEKVRIGGGKHSSQRPQQSKPAKSEPRPDRSAGLQSGPVPLPMSVAGWPGGLPFGYVGQVPSLPAIVPVDGSAAAAKALQLRPRRCATHCYIAQNIYYQQLTRMNPFWPAKPYNLNVLPGAAEHAFSGRAQDGKSSVGAVPGQPSKEKSIGFSDATSQRKQPPPPQLLLQQPLQAGAASNNILPAPAFIFPINQPTAGGSSAVTNRAAAPDASPGPAAAGGFNYGSLTQGEAQYLVLQNHGYPFPIPAHVGAPPYRGAPQALPFFNGSLYASQILHPSQLHQQPPPHSQGHQNASNSTGSSSSQKHNSHKADPVEVHLPQKRPPPRQVDGEIAGAGGDSPSSVDSRVSHKGGALYGHNFVMPLNPQNLALMALGADKSQQPHASPSQPPQQQQQGMKVDLAPSQAFAMSFASFNGAVAAAAAAAASGQPHALDFSSAAQNHAIFQSLPEATRHAYQVQHKKSQNQQILPDSKSLAGSMNSAGDDARKTVLAAKASSSRGNSIDGSSTRVMNMMNGSARAAPSRSDVAAPPSGSSTSTALQQRQQQHLLQLQKQQQPQHHPQLPMQQQSQLASRVAKGGPPAFADHHRIPGGAAMSKLPSALSGIPQALVQGNSHSPGGSPQWKDNANSRSSSAMPSTPANPPGVPAKSSHLQGRNAPSPQSQQISFGVRPSPAAVTASAGGPVASPAASSAKSMSGSPRASPAAAKMVTPPSSVAQSPHQPKVPMSGGHGRNNGKSPSPSILGQPHIATPPGPGMKQPQQQSQKQQAFTPPQIFFANSYLQQQQQPGPPHSLTLGGAAVGAASDTQAKTAAPPNNGMKGIPFMSAAGFPYFHGMSSVPVKPAEQKPAAGS